MPASVAWLGTFMFFFFFTVSMETVIFFSVVTRITQTELAAVGWRSVISASEQAFTLLHNYTYAHKSKPQEQNTVTHWNAQSFSSPDSFSWLWSQKTHQAIENDTFTTHFKGRSHNRYIPLFACYMINRIHNHRCVTKNHFLSIFKTSNSNFHFMSI